MPGAVLTYDGKRRVVSGNHNERHVLFGAWEAGVPKSRRAVERRNAGLVFV